MTSLARFACLFPLLCAGLVLAEDKPAEPTAFQPPQIKLLTAVAETFEEKPFLTLTFEVTNPNATALTYTGYPPRERNIGPIFYKAFQKGGKWEMAQPPFCGTGIENHQLAAKSSAVCTLHVPADKWDWLRIGIGQMLCGEGQTETVWSVILPRYEIDKMAAKPKAAN